MWLETIIKGNLMKLSLTAKFAPASDVMEMTEQLWVEAFEDELGRADEALDAPRIEAAFRQAKRKIANWPAPSEVIGLMGPRTTQPLRVSHAPEPTPLGFKAFEICSRIANGEITKEEGNRLMEEERHE